MPRIRVIEGVIYEVHNVNSGYGPSGINFEIGSPPERVDMPGRANALTQGEYVVVAVRPSVISLLFPRTRRDVAIAYTSMNTKGDIRTVGFAWTLLCFLVCVCGFALSYLVMIGLVPSDSILANLPASGWLPAMKPSASQMAALLALISIAIGVIGLMRLHTLRSAITAVAGTRTVRQAQGTSTAQ